MNIDSTTLSDSELSIMAGADVLSLYPEDLPHFKPSIFEPYTPSEEYARRSLLTAQVRKRFPFWDGRSSDLSILATSKDAAVMTHRHGYRAIFAVILKPGRTLSASFLIANAAGLKPDDVTENPISDRHYKSFSIFHEIGHVADRNDEDSHFYGAFRNELYAESYSSNRYRLEGEEGQVLIRGKILERALMGFLKQPPCYWLAPSLARRFNDNARMPNGPLETWQAYAELRLRTAAAVQGHDLSMLSSADIGKALMAWDEGKSLRIADMKLRGLIETMDRFRDGRTTEEAYLRRRQMLAALPGVLAGPNLGPGIKEAGMQIVKAAEMFCPGLLPHPSMKGDVSHAYR